MYRTISPPQVIIDLISEFNVLHRKQLQKVLQELKNQSFCQMCNKYIFKYVYSLRNSGIGCCSSECVDNYNYNYNYNHEQIYYKK
jgi:hypothetical protein